MADLELATIFLPQSPKCWDYGSMPSCLDYLFIFVCVTVNVCAHVHECAWKTRRCEFWSLGTNHLVCVCVCRIFHWNLGLTD